MKRLISFFIIAAALSSLVSCAKVPAESDTEDKKGTMGGEMISESSEKADDTLMNEESTEKETEKDPFDYDVMKAGFAREAVAVMKNTPLSGFDNALQRRSTEQYDDITVSCNAFQDESGEIALLFTCDLCTMEIAVSDNIKTKMETDFGVKPENVFVCSTHSHSAPALSTTSPEPTETKKFRSAFLESAKTAAKKAIDDLAPAEIYSGIVSCPNLNYVRRYQLADGTWMTNPTSTTNPAVKHESTADNKLQILEFKRTGDKKDIIMVNWGAHPAMIGISTSTQVSADYVGYLRDYVEKTLGADCSFYQEAVGNLIVYGALSGEKIYYSHSLSLTKKYGETLGDYVVKASKNLNKVDCGKIIGKIDPVVFVYDHSRDAEASKGKEVYNLWKNGKVEEAKALAKKYGFTGGVYEARDVYAKSTKPEKETLDIYLLSFGDVAFVGAPYEMFDTNEMFIRSNSPFDTTFVCSITNTYKSYIPSAIAFEHGGYEVNSCKFLAGTGEILAEEFVKVLKQLHK